MAVALVLAARQHSLDGVQQSEPGVQHSALVGCLGATEQLPLDEAPHKKLIGQHPVVCLIAAPPATTKAPVRAKAHNAFVNMFILQGYDFQSTNDSRKYYRHSTNVTSRVKWNYDFAYPTRLRV